MIVHFLQKLENIRRLKTSFNFKIKPSNVYTIRLKRVVINKTEIYVLKYIFRASIKHTLGFSTSILSNVGGEIFPCNSVFLFF